MSWTDIARATYARDGKRYASDMTDAEWSMIEGLLPPQRRAGRPRKTDLRQVVNALLYIASTGCQWRMLPGDFPPRSTVQRYFYDWRDRGLMPRISQHLVAIEVTTNAIGDASTLPDLLAQIPRDEQILSVGGDGAYDTRACHAAIAERGADAVIPVRRNGRPWTKDGAGVDARNEALRATKRLGCAIWKKWSGYHRRSLVETKMHCFKLLSQRVVARTFDRQITELKVRAAIFNRFAKMGTSVTVRFA